MMKNGHPYSNENGWVDDKLISDEPKEIMEGVLEWIRLYIFPRKTPLLGRTSYGIKHILQHDTGIYLTNNQFKDAMLLSGYKPVSENDLNWEYRISKRSPIFDNNRDGERTISISREDVLAAYDKK